MIDELISDFIETRRQAEEREAVRAAADRGVRSNKLKFVGLG